MERNEIKFSLGYNFDPKLIQKVGFLNSQYSKIGRVSEFFAALPEGPYPSTRPDYRINPISFNELASQIKEMEKYKINLNYLLNGKVNLQNINETKFMEFLKKIFDIGVNQLIVYSPELCNYIKKINDKFLITISSVFNIRTMQQVKNACDSGADFIYIDSIFVNRDFKLLRQFKEYSKIPLKLYANVSCLSQCEKKDFHYESLSNPDTAYQIKMNDELFTYCSREKINNPVKWLQMQWIRPEDIGTYAEEGYTFFKLADRIAPSENLIFIAEHYLKGTSSKNLFPLMERNGTKYCNISSINNKLPFYINSSKIPKDFIEHFRSGECNSTNIYCPYCNQLAKKAIQVNVSLQNKVHN